MVLIAHSACTFDMTSPGHCAHKQRSVSLLIHSLKIANHSLLYTAGNRKVSDAGKLCSWPAKSPPSLSTKHKSDTILKSSINTK